MKVYLDDTRLPPPGWVLTRTIDETIALLKTGTVIELSLDHDLSTKETGYEVLRWIEIKVITEDFKPPIMHVHSQNPVGKKRMESAIDSIHNVVNETQKVRTNRGALYWKSCGCEAFEEEIHCRYCSRTYYCDSCGWKGPYPRIIDGEVLGAIELCPVCNKSANAKDEGEEDL